MITNNTLRKLIKWGVKHKLLKAPKLHRYAIEMQIRVDGKIVHQFPAEVDAPGRRAAKFEAAKRVSVTTGTVAKKIHLIKYNKKPV